MFRVLFVFALTALSACAPAAGYNEFIYLANTKPSEWQGPQLDAARAQGMGNFCSLYNRGFRGDPERIASGPIPYDQADFEAIERSLRTFGLTSRDIELLRRRSRTFGTNQTFAGLSCSLGNEPRVNRSYYPGIGNQWQAVLSSSEYVYLRGDGTPSGMRVYAWN